MQYINEISTNIYRKFSPPPTEPLVDIGDSIDIPELTDAGKLEIILGLIYSDKITKLIETYYNYISFYDVLVYNYKSKVKNGDPTILSSSQYNKKIPCIFTNNLYKHLEDMSQTNIILINDAQFFKDDDLYLTVNTLLNKYKKTIILYGLESNFDGLARLIPMSNSIVKLCSKCNLCKTGKRAIIMLCRTHNDKEDNSITKYIYDPVCRSCYYHFTNNKC